MSVKRGSYVLNLLLCALYGALLAVETVCRSLIPALVLPPWDIPLLLAVCLLALLLERCVGGQGARDWTGMTALAAGTFGLLPACAGLVDGTLALRLAVLGGGVFWVTGVIFDTLTERISGGGHSGAACAVAAGMLFLAGQGLTHIAF